MSDGVYCVCCGYKTIAQRDNYEICPICFWEDDVSQEAYPHDNGANPVSLHQAQKNFIEFGACDKNMKRYVRVPFANDERDLNWKLLEDKG